MNYFGRLFCGLSLALLLEGCETAKRTFGFDRNHPDEFGISEHPSLTLPPRFDELPQPDGSTKKVLSSHEAAQKGKEVLVKKKTTSPLSKSVGEKNLLSKLGSNKPQENIRDTVDTEAEAEKTGPSKIQQLLNVKPDESKAKVINPEDEQARLEAATTPSISQTSSDAAILKNDD